MKNISIEEKEKLELLYYGYLNNDLVQRMKDIPMHRGSNCYIHSFLVARNALKRAIRRKKKLDLESILVASIFHDYYLYDWRKDKTLLKHHGKNHPSIAVSNAKRDFGISDFASELILSHMWPINFKKFPKTIEAKIVANADTHIALKEVLCSKKYKAKHIEKTLQKITELFY